MAAGWARRWRRRHHPPPDDSGAPEQEDREQGTEHDQRAARDREARRRRRRPRPTRASPDDSFAGRRRAQRRDRDDQRGVRRLVRERPALPVELLDLLLVLESCCCTAIESPIVVALPMSAIRHRLLRAEVAQPRGRGP